MARASRLTLAALGALVGVAVTPATAQIVVGGSNPSVEVNWSVLDQLGPEPTLPGMLMPPARPPQAAHPRLPTTASGTADSSGGVAYRPFRPQGDTQGKPGQSARADLVHPAVNDLVKAARSAGKPVAKADAKPRRVEAKAEKTAQSKAEDPKLAALQPRSDAPLQVAELPKVERPRVKAPEIAPPPVVAQPVVPSVAAPVQPARVEPPRPPVPVQTARVDPPAAQPMPILPQATAPAPAPVAPQPVARVEPPAPPPAAPVQVAKAAPQQTASLPPAAAVSHSGDTLSILFSGDEARLPGVARHELDGIVKRMDKNASLSLQLMAYAEGDEANASKARRLSLSRALEVRKYLMEAGVRSTRIEVRALGNKSEGGPADRVDAVLVGR